MYSAYILNMYALAENIIGGRRASVVAVNGGRGLPPSITMFRFDCGRAALSHRRGYMKQLPSLMT